LPKDKKIEVKRKDPKTKKPEVKKSVGKKVEVKKVVNKGDAGTKVKGSPRPTTTKGKIRQPKNNAEVDEVANSMKKQLAKKPEDKVKEKEELKRLETEQRKVVLGTTILDKKDDCIKELGKEGYEKIYNVLKKANQGKIKSQDMSSEIEKIIGKDKRKMNYVFIIDQIVATDANKY